MHRLFALICLAALGCAAMASSIRAQQVPPLDEAPACVRDGTRDIARYDLGPGISIANAIDAPLTKVPGNPLNGRTLMAMPERGNCTTCHAVSDIRKKARQADSTTVTLFGLQGTIGPALDEIGKKYTEGELRLLVVNPQVALPGSNSVMPAYHHVEGLKRVRKACVGRAILTAQEVEDVVAYLVTLKGAQ